MKKLMTIVVTAAVLVLGAQGASALAKPSPKPTHTAETKEVRPSKTPSAKPTQSLRPTAKPSHTPETEEVRPTKSPSAKPTPVKTPHVETKEVRSTKSPSAKPTASKKPGKN
jgi:hypothetical protein